MKNTLQIGQVVQSINGRDQNKFFIIVKLEDHFVYLVDGKLRSLNKPKRKKTKHIQPTNIMIEEIRNKLLRQQTLYDKEVRRCLAEVLKRYDFNG